MLGQRSGKVLSARQHFDVSACGTDVDVTVAVSTDVQAVVDDMAVKTGEGSLVDETDVLGSLSVCK